jgi:hypothetical protein
LAIYLLMLSASAVLVGCGPKHVSAPAPVDQGSFLVHLVTRQGEAVRALSKWYTGSDKPAKEIARLSGVSESAPLKVGQRVLIPTTHVKKTAPPPKPKARPKAPQIAKKDESAENATSSDPLQSPEPESAMSDPDPLDPSAWTAPTGDVETNTPNTAGSNDTKTGLVQEGLGVPTEPDVATTKPVESFEELLMKEQQEVERLRREMQAAP